MLRRLQRRGGHFEYAQESLRLLSAGEAIYARFVEPKPLSLGSLQARGIWLADLGLEATVPRCGERVERLL